ncbi:MerR family transcriptional regulator [Pseudomonas sp. NPDC078700]|uniref:MerR family transcriptional regulator n=1 Tax=Pseudomonas sp. NPDC078700 TaxID=3364424 RepID=UPI0037CC25DF
MPDPFAALSLNSSALKQEELFPIREVSRLTGVNSVTLRAWERRYGLIQPTRTESGHRLYSQADIESVRNILTWIERGVAVSKVGKILAKSRSLKAASVPVYDVVTGSEWQQWQRQLHTAVSCFDDIQLDRLYGQVFSSYPLPVVFQAILMPLWQDLLMRHNDIGQTSEWLFYDAFLRGRVMQRLHANRAQAEDRVIVAALPGHCRELELLVTGLLLSHSSVAVSVFAIGQPLDELVYICDRVKPLGLVLFSNQVPSEQLPQTLKRLALAVNCPVSLAGECAELIGDALNGSAIATLGSEGQLMSQRLQQFLAGNFDT